MFNYLYQETMKRFKLWLLAVILMLCGAMTFTSCSKDDPPANEEENVVLQARVSSVYHIDEADMTVYNIEYPSTDPFGKPVMLSGTITIGDEVTKDNPGKGLLLYNHFSVYRADECPSKGDLKMQELIAGSGLITISADYYGFGITEDKLQAYCISSVNAQASVDALLAAKELLPTLGYSWNDDILFNIGYSQGGQTSMAVVRLIDEKYPALHITFTIAGAGAYDIPETYRQLIQADVSGMPSTVINVLLSYNKYFNLGIPYSDIFIEPLLSNIDEWIFSKKYTREEIDEKVGSYDIVNFVTPAMLDIESNVSKSFLEVMAKDNLCTGWTPRTDEHIILVQHSKDITVPPANTVNLYNFLKSQGVEDVRLILGNFSKFAGQPAHKTGAIIFATSALVEICTILDIPVWIKIEDLL